MRVVVLHNLVPDDADPDDRDVLVQVEVVSEALQSLGHEPISLACTLDLATLQADLGRLRPAAVFNLVESLGGFDRLAVLAAALMDALGLPYTGSPTEALFLTNDKLLAKERLAQAGLPTPGWIGPDHVRLRESRTGLNPVLQGQETSPRAGERYILKPIAEHASYGMDETSVVSCGDSASLCQRLQEHSARLGCRCFAEAYIDGREFNLSVLTGPQGPAVLPAAEIDFSAFPADKPRIVDYRAKWEEGCFEFVHTPRRFDFRPADEPLLKELQAMARSCWHVFRLHGYVRVDFRVDAAGRPWILEINANPCLSPDAGFAAALQRAGIGFEQAVQRILDEAVQAGRLDP